jgi:probable HAF family extracellular repeat protein
MTSVRWSAGRDSTPARTPSSTAAARCSPCPTSCTYNGGDSAAAGINNNHQIVGASTDANGISHAVLWQNGTITDLGTLGGASSSANAINNNGQIVGMSATSTGTAYFLDSGGP